MADRIMCGDPVGSGDDVATAGCLMRFKSRPERVLLLTAMHAVVGLTTKRGARVQAPGGTDIGTVSAWSGLEGLTTVDAALVWVDPARVDPQLRGLGAITGVNENPALQSAVRLAGEGHRPDSQRN